MPPFFNDFAALGRTSSPIAQFYYMLRSNISTKSQKPLNVERYGNVISITGVGHLSNSEIIFSEIFRATHNAGYEDIVIDITKADAFFADIAVPLCAIISKYKKLGINFELRLDINTKVGRTFLDSNWAHIIDASHQESQYRGYLQHPAVIYNDDYGLVTSLNNILDCILKSAKNLNRNDLAVLEWALNEVMENSLRHSESPFGGIVHLSRFDKNRKIIEIVIADGGKGIPASLGAVEKYQRLNDMELLELAIQEGVTNGNGMGNGLFGASQTSVASGGSFSIRSQNALLSLFIDKFGNPAKNIANRRIPFTGTAVIASYDYSSPGVLQNALKFKGKTHSLAIDYVEQYEGECIIILKNEVQHFSTRLAAEGLRTKLVNLRNMTAIDYFLFDLEGVPVLSSSFADELFGKMKIILGESVFLNTVRFKNITDDNRIILERAISQRTSI